MEGTPSGGEHFECADPGCLGTRGRALCEGGPRGLEAEVDLSVSGLVGCLPRWRWSRRRAHVGRRLRSTTAIGRGRWTSCRERERRPTTGRGPALVGRLRKTLARAHRASLRPPLALAPASSTTGRSRACRRTGRGRTRPHSLLRRAALQSAEESGESHPHRRRSSSP